MSLITPTWWSLRRGSSAPRGRGRPSQSCSGSDPGGRRLGSFRRPLPPGPSGVVPLGWAGQTDSFARTAGGRRVSEEGEFFTRRQRGGDGIDGRAAVGGFGGRGETDVTRRLLGFVTGARNGAVLDGAVVVVVVLGVHVLPAETRRGRFFRPASDGVSSLRTPRRRQRRSRVAAGFKDRWRLPGRPVLFSSGELGQEERLWCRTRGRGRGGGGRRGGGAPAAGDGGSLFSGCDLLYPSLWIWAKRVLRRHRELPAEARRVVGVTEGRPRSPRGIRPIQDSNAGPRAALCICARETLKGEAT